MFLSICFSAVVLKKSTFEHTLCQREAFHSAYPLTPALWKAWIEDETRMISTVEDKGKVADLYDRCGEYSLVLKSLRFDFGQF